MSRYARTGHGVSRKTRLILVDAALAVAANVVDFAAAGDVSATEVMSALRGALEDPFYAHCSDRIGPDRVTVAVRELVKG